MMPTEIYPEGGCPMKSTLLLPAILSLALVSCEVTMHDSPVGPPPGTGIAGVSFTVDTTYMLASAATLVAEGRVKNTGTGNISSPWYVECFFYADSTMSTILGNNDAQIGVPLSPGQSAFRMITLSSTNVDVRRFPNFKVGDFSAVYKN
jgi:hypothetical protein